MHLKLDSSGSIDDGDVARDLGQAPADIVVLSAGDGVTTMLSKSSWSCSSSSP